MTDEEQERYEMECTTEEAEAIEKVILNALRKHNNPNAIAVIIGLSNALLTAAVRVGMSKVDFFRLLLRDRIVARGFPAEGGRMVQVPPDDLVIRMGQRVGPQDFRKLQENSAVDP